MPISWFALLFTGRYPGGLYDFHASFARYATYVYSYFYLATDRWPGFSGDPDVDYPVHLRLGPPLEEYSRMKVLFRLIIGIPVFLIAYAMSIVAQIAAVIAWFAIVITGKQPEGIYQMLRLGLSYQHRADAVRPAADRGLARVHAGGRPCGAAAGRGRRRRAHAADRRARARRGAGHSAGRRGRAGPRRLRPARAAARRGELTRRASVVVVVAVVVPLPASAAVIVVVIG